MASKSIGADNWTIEGWVMPPVDYEPGKRYPTILTVHGGPHFAYGEAFFHEFQVLCAAGYAVVMTNPRGRSIGTIKSLSALGPLRGPPVRVLPAEDRRATIPSVRPLLRV